MSGFFKKLFNRVIGKKEEEAPPTIVTEALPPAPESAPPPEPVAEVEEQAAPGLAAVAPKVSLQPEASVEAEPATVTAGVAEDVSAPKPRRKSAKQSVVVAPEPEKPEPKSEPRPEMKKAEARKPRPEKQESRPAVSKTPAAVPPPAAAVPPPQPALPKLAPEEVVNTPQQVEVAAPLPPEPEAAPPPLPVIEVKPELLQPLVVPAEEPAQRGGWLSRLKEGLSKSSKSITGSITSIFTKRKLDAATLEELEDVLLQADLGLPMAERIIKAVSEGRYDKEIEPEEVKRILAAEVAKVLKPVEVPFNFGAEKPFIVLVVGVNGAGKTTTIGKLGAIASREGFKVMFAACDTFRAAAIEQLTVWGQRIGARTMSRPTGADASGLAFDAIREAKADGTDILFIDTAGRLQNKAYLMDELDKIVRVIRKLDDTAPHAVLLVLDATTGQNAMAQADIFTKVAGVTGIIMTKLDGTARGGILVAIAERFKLPVHAIGVGEQIDDLQPFDADEFARAIAGLEEQ
jgi:fused signal recognition particle receptor